MPIRLHLYHLKVLWLMILIFRRIYAPTSTSQFTNDSTFSCTRDTSQEKERLRLNGRDIRTISLVDFTLIDRWLLIILLIINLSWQFSYYQIQRCRNHRSLPFQILQIISTINPFTFHNIRQHILANIRIQHPQRSNDLTTFKQSTISIF